MGTRKPEPAFFEQMLLMLNTAPKNCLFVDDGEANVNARGVGLYAEHYHLDQGLDVLRSLLHGHGITEV